MLQLSCFIACDDQPLQWIMRLQALCVGGVLLGLTYLLSRWLANRTHLHEAEESEHPEQPEQQDDMQNKAIVTAR